MDERTPEGDARFREVVFGITDRPDSTSPSVISEGAALSLGRGTQLKDPATGKTTASSSKSFAEFYMMQGRIDLLREVVGAHHPSQIDGWKTDAAINWLNFLRSSVFRGDRHHRSLVRAAFEPIGQHSAELVQFLIELRAEAPFMKRFESAGGPAAALLTEVRMRMRIQELQGAKDQALVSPEHLELPAPTERRPVAV